MRDFLFFRRSRSLLVETIKKSSVEEEKNNKTIRGICKAHDYLKILKLNYPLGPTKGRRKFQFMGCSGLLLKLLSFKSYSCRFSSESSSSLSVSMLLDLPILLRSLMLLLLFELLHKFGSINCRWLSKEDEADEVF